MSCVKANSVATPITYIHDVSGVTVSADDWHAVRQMAALAAGQDTLSKAVAPERNVEEVCAHMADRIARDQRIGEEARNDGLYLSWGYLDEDDFDMLTSHEQEFEQKTRTFIQTVKTMPMTEGTVAVLNQMRQFGPDRAIAMAHAVAQQPWQTPPPTPEELADTIMELTRTAEYSEFESSNWNHEEGDEVTLADMEYGHLAGNNCFNASLAVEDAVIDEDLAPDGWTHERVETLHMDDSPGSRGSGVHWANMFTSPTGERWVVDYTARQFGPDVPYPTVAPYDQWLNHVATRTKSIWGSDLTTVTAYEDLSDTQGRILHISGIADSTD